MGRKAAARHEHPPGSVEWHDVEQCAEAWQPCGRIAAGWIEQSDEAHEGQVRIGVAVGAVDVPLREGQYAKTLTGRRFDAPDSSLPPVFRKRNGVAFCTGQVR